MISVYVDFKEIEKYSWSNMFDSTLPVYLKITNNNKILFKVEQNRAFLYLKIEEYLDLYYKFLYPVLKVINMISASVTKEDFFFKFGQESNRYLKNHFFRWQECCKDAFYLKVLYENFERNINIIYFDTESNVIGKILTIVDDEDIGSFAYDTYIKPQLEG